MDPNPDRETTFSVGTLLVKAERYEDAIDMTKRVALLKEALTVEERDLFSLAFNKMIASRRASRKILLSVEEILEKKGEPTAKIKEWSEKVGKEINIFCTEMKHILIDHVLPLCATPEDKVLCNTMIGDCFRYLAELTNKLRDEEQREKFADQALEAYNRGTKIAEHNLNVADPSRLRLSYNFSVLYRDIWDSEEMARYVAVTACDEANPELSALDEQAHKESVEILKLLTENARTSNNQHAYGNLALQSALAPFPDSQTTSFVAKSLAEAKRYEDVLDMFKCLALMSKDTVVLTSEERDLILLAFKKVTTSRQASWRTLVSIQGVQQIKEYAEKAGEEINGFCSEIASVLTDRILPKCPPEADKLLYLTMIGDCFRYLAELTDGESREKLADQALEAYKKGTTIAEKILDAADVARLELALSYSEFYYEIHHNVEMARLIGELALSDARRVKSEISLQAWEVFHRLDLNVNLKWTSYAREVEDNGEQYQFEMEEDF